MCAAAAPRPPDLQQRLQNLPDVLPADSADVTAQHDLRLLLDRALEQVRAEFEPHTWRAFTLSVLEGWDTRRVATELATTANNVRQAKSRILRRLRQQLGEL